jgi:hypothetical protein
LAMVAGLFILRSTHLGSYAKTAFKNLKASAKSMVPLDKQLEVIRNEVAEFRPELQKQVSALAAETVAVQNLRQEISDVHANLDKQGKRIVAMKEELLTAKTSSDGRARDRLRNRLERDLASYKRVSDELKAREALLEAKEQALVADQERLAAMRSQKELWEVTIAQMETEVKLLQIAENRSPCQVDDSKFERIKGMIADVRNQIKVQQTAIVMWSQYSDEAPTAEKKTLSDTQLMKAVDEIVGDSGDTKEVRK